MKVHDESKALKCDVCLKLFSTKGELEIHYRKHTGEKPFACQYCPSRFICKEYLSNHQRRIHGDSPYVCDICNKTFRRPSELKIHEDKHKDGKIDDNGVDVKKTKLDNFRNRVLDIDCKMCDIHFTDQDVFTLHCREVHDYFYSCDMCDFSTKEVRISTLLDFLRDCCKPLSNNEIDSKYVR